VIDRAGVSEDKYADRIGTQFVSTVYHGKAMLDAGSGGEERALHLPACRDTGAARYSSTRWRTDPHRVPIASAMATVLRAMSACMRSTMRPSS
jgi:hypothetical protein